MQRKFNSRQRLYLAILAGWRCVICDTPLSFDLHGDHVVPFARNGKTLLRNGQALCPTCNRRKGVTCGSSSSKKVADRRPRNT
jgi:5-methylcytosine-specific restriction endonuclease McrA